MKMKEVAPLGEFVSVVIPTYNRPDLVMKALASVLSQTFPVQDVIVVDDSTDNRTELLFASLADKRVRYMKNTENMGANYSRNRGLSVALGEWVAFLDDDDQWLPTKLEQQVIAAKANPELGLIYTGTEIVHAKGGVSYPNFPTEAGDLSTRILIGNCIGSTSTVMVRKSLAVSLGGFDEQLPAIQDYDLWIRICQKVQVGAVKQVLVRYYYHDLPGQISKDLSKRGQAESQIETKYAELFLGLSHVLQKQRKVNRLLIQATHAHQFGGAGQARVLLGEAMRLRPTAIVLARWLLTFLPFSVSLWVRGARKQTIPGDPQA